MLTRQRAVLIAAILFAHVYGSFAAYVPPAQRMTLNQNRSWKFIKQDVSGAQATGFNDAVLVGGRPPPLLRYPLLEGERPPSLLRSDGTANMLPSTRHGWPRRRVFIEFEAAFLDLAGLCERNACGDAPGRLSPAFPTTSPRCFMPETT